MAAFQVDPEHGLSAGEASGRLARYGRNELDAEPPRPAWRKFLEQFASILVILLIAAAAISAGLWLYESAAALPYEAIAIMAIVILNAFMGYIQEARAERAAAALRDMSAARATVIRDAKRQSILATEVVPGDIILVEEGDTIPADARLVQCAALQTAEAALTGESLPVSKDVAPIAGDAEIGDRRNMIFSGTIAVYGHGRAVVTATGMLTEMGRIA
ncbi:HAD-IC family P-type ATPase, partial [Pseudorhodoplanes sp.]|uniref:HAD-IC family P-type ATPase n=1 Tax=Pseudorhodoplanes sp. TaxID=1934341 RepID=UPI002CE70D5E